MRCKFCRFWKKNQKWKFKRFGEGLKCLTSRAFSAILKKLTTSFSCDILTHIYSPQNFSVRSIVFEISKYEMVAKLKLFSRWPKSWIVIESSDLSFLLTIKKKRLTYPNELRTNKGNWLTILLYMVTVNI